MVLHRQHSAFESDQPVAHLIQSRIDPRLNSTNPRIHSINPLS